MVLAAFNIRKQHARYRLSISVPFLMFLVGLLSVSNARASAEDPLFEIPFRLIVPQCGEDGTVVWDPSDPICLTYTGPNPPAPCEGTPPLYDKKFTPPTQRRYMSVSNELTLYLPDVWNEMYVPKTMVVTGGSRGIGYSVACYMAEKQDLLNITDSKVISLSARDPDVECDGVTYVKFDISKQNGEWNKVHTALGDAPIDFLLLNAGYDAPGSLRDMTGDDLKRVFANNVWGNHDVWYNLYGYLNSIFSVVLSVSSIAGSAPGYFFKRQPYSLSKMMLEYLTLAYAQEESKLHENTRYGVVIQADARTKFALTSMIPQVNAEDDICQQQFDDYGLVTNAYLNTFGVNMTEVAKQYHMIVTLYWLIKEGLIPTLEERPPVRFSVGGVDGFDEVLLDVGLYNTNVLRPEAASKCYSKTWERYYSFFNNSCPLPQPIEPYYELLCEGFESLKQFQDPRELTCPL
eukprot:CAMPEP_0201993124 /NCGR_PEP_ID=MMETSP0905-20130828/1453_1 /ASSEMBLY_ACC=CAM_ASM_000554 /TAXON_ID=420261 /ORGANISM="Thalassiosira antarctica, Strain CCMP982" /LENGTH=460 /DNA_ID=CAMNT_0048547911 /DNA_START=886 /DNA_END=2268 /DNA_ORIENTATION=+